ncbi:hypothetical protein VTJ83DRAFT_6949 [Remersonia thermophila]|uniref:AGC-kinase C-terminal domain-containing protein n=1 Tax=Remersonia thermophila TaxID=72144 RepID=A0ABR4D733_9PEZI
MLSHLRFHRRGHSNSASASPSSEQPAQPSQWDAADPPSRKASPRPSTPSCSTVPSQPPVLPPIARVASTDPNSIFSQVHDTLAPAPGTAPAPAATPAPQAPSSAPVPSSQPESRPAVACPDPGNAGFIGGAALQNLRRASQDPSTRDSLPYRGGSLPENRLSRAKPPPPPIDTTLHKPKSSWFSTPTELQGQSAGKRQSGSRSASDAAQPQPPERKKGLPFLKNPVSSLLSRRKASHPPPEAEPTPAYDPSIRGTRVHDFSAPRPKKPQPVVVTDPRAARLEPASRLEGPIEPAGTSQRSLDPVITSDGVAGAVAGAPEHQAADSAPISESSRPSSIQPDGAAGSLHASSSAASSATAVVPLPHSSSVRSTASRQLSRVSRQGSVASALPRHMKSTSSRFSFDMVGAAKQEKLLEERHRQRQQEKQEPAPVEQDPRFAELDYDEDFDYDAMMDDDGLEEKIPGINADYDEDLDAELDPDNDQENFAGFVFQRSNPVSYLNSPLTPAVVATPRDANGEVIGFALTKDATPDPSAPVSPMPPMPAGSTPVPDTTSVPKESLVAGETEGQQSVRQPSHQSPAAAAEIAGPSTSAQAVVNDDIYFDDGLRDELDFEHDDAPFDESLFDIDDTDQFGRPIPGAFAAAKERMQMQAAQKKSNQDSVITSSGSGQSGPAQSTGQTSLSADPPVANNPENPPDHPTSGVGLPSQELAYQAALAEAAQKAAASGKFRRDSSPESRLGDGADEPPERSYIDDYDDDDRFNNNFDDEFDFDDEAIIAEANASALANDADGFYGQEFGFYSAPLPQPSAATSSLRNGGGINGESLFQYANGGYFGPANAGLQRSTSGRVCREPNLTPITERSEYSNRNSIMSFTLPPALGSAGGAGSERNSASLASPGLAQLAMLPDDADNMSLSALMKLRSKAWGGSQASLVSSREGSPRSERPGTAGMDGTASPYGTVPAHLAGHVRVNSGLSVWSPSDVVDDGPVSGPAGGRTGGNESTAAAALAMMAATSSGGGGGSAMFSPRPGSAGGTVYGVGGGLGGSAGGPGLAASPLPQQPLQSLYLNYPPPAVSASLMLGTQQQEQKHPLPPLGGSPCSPVLESEETEGVSK